MNREVKIVLLITAIIITITIWYFYDKEVYTILGTLIKLDYYPPSTHPKAILVMTFNNKLPPGVIHDNIIMYIKEFNNAHEIVDTILEANKSISFVPIKINDHQLGTNAVPNIIVEKYLAPISLSGIGSIGYKTP